MWMASAVDLSMSRYQESSNIFYIDSVASFSNLINIKCNYCIVLRNNGLIDIVQDLKT